MFKKKEAPAESGGKKDKGKRAEERRKHREALAQKQKEEEEEARRRAAKELEEKEKSKQVNIPLFLKERIGLRDLELKRAKNRQNWEESRAVKAYSWYTRMSGPNRKQLKKIVASMKECDVVPDDIDLLPWSPSGGWVDHMKIDEITRRLKASSYDQWSLEGRSHE